jgi:hypothetical protein
MQDMSDSYHNIKGAILQSIDDVELESLEKSIDTTSTSTDGESTTPTACVSPLPMNPSEFENTVYELIDRQRYVCFLKSMSHAEALFFSIHLFF